MAIPSAVPSSVASRVSIIVVTYARDNDLKELLAYLEKVDKLYPLLEVVLVDNNEDGADRSHLLGRLRRAIYCRYGKNLGCSGGRNVGIRQSHGQVLVFLDDDALPDPVSFVDVVIRKFETLPRLG